MSPPVLDRRALLGRLEIFSELGPAELDAVVAATRAKVFAAREVVVRQGDPAEMAFAVVYGRLKVVTTSSGDQQTVLGVLREGEIFGELAILDGGVRSATVIAIEPTLLLGIDRRKLHALLIREATVSYKLLRVLARRLRQVNESRGVLDVPARLAKQLIQLAEEDGERIGRRIRLRTELSQRELGAMIGATRESVNKTLAAFVKRGVLQAEGKQLVILDEEALRAMAEGGGAGEASLRKPRGGAG